MQARVLVVDDEPAWQEILRDALEAAGCSAAVASSFQEAEAALRSEVYHVAIIDIRLEGGGGSSTGMDLLERILEFESDLPFCIVVTGYPTVGDTRDSFKKYHVWDFVSKLDFDRDTFSESVGQALTWALERDQRGGLDSHWETFTDAVHGTRPSARQEATRALVEYLAGALELPPPVMAAPRSEHLVAALLDTSSIFRDTAIPQPMILIALQRESLREEDLDDLRQALESELTRTTQVLLLLAEEQQLLDAQPLLDRMREIYSYDLIPLYREQLHRILLARHPRRKFRRFVCSQVSLASVSPFVVAGPVPETMFFGRERELREITEHAANASYALIGGRRIGKTSMLKRLERVRLPAAGYRALYHDCSFTPTQEELVQAVRGDRSWFPQGPPAASTLREVVLALPDDRPLVLLLDEADRLVQEERAAGYPMFHALRALHTTGRCRLVLSGEQTLRGELADADSPFFNFAVEMVIGRLDRAACEELVTRPLKQLEVELAGEAAILRRIWETTNGHPNIVQCLCQRLMHRLHQKQTRRLTIQDVEEVLADPDFLRRDFLSICWQRASPLEQLCSLVMARDRDLCRVTAIHRAMTELGLEVTLNQVDAALERLVDLRSVLARTRDGYAFAITGFPDAFAHAGRMEEHLALALERLNPKAEGSR